jgi:hypothetical protein
MVSRERLDVIVANRYGNLAKAAVTLRLVGVAVQLVGCLITAALLFIGFKSYNEGDKMVGIYLIIGGVLAFIAHYVVGVFVAAFGEAGKALADIAVNTDPSLWEERVEPKTTGAAVALPTNVALAETVSSSAIEQGGCPAASGAAEPSKRDLMARLPSRSEAERPQAMQLQATCPKCGAPVKAGARRCGQCWTALGTWA